MPAETEPAQAASDGPILSGGAYDPVRSEETVTALRVTGTIPEWLDGRYVRNGPNPIGPVDPATLHWFMGDGMVHGVRLRGGRAEWYRNRWVRSADAAKALGEPVPASAGVSVAANTTVIQHAGTILALVEAGGAAYALSDELETVGVWDFRGTKPGGYTAHPKLDPATGELHAVSYRFDRPGVVEYSVVEPRGTLARSIDVPVAGSPLVHDMGLTQRHVVVLDLPIEFDLARAMRAVGVPERMIGPGSRVASKLIGRVPMNGRLADLAASRLRNGDMPYSWAPDHPSRLGVLPRDGRGTDVRWFEIAQCFVFHVLGAYDEEDEHVEHEALRWFEIAQCFVFHVLGAYDEEDEQGRPVAVVVDGVRYDEVFTDRANGPDGATTRLTRWRLDLITGGVSETTVDGRQQEFPRIDERLIGRPYRYGYATALMPDGTGRVDDRFLRHDLVAGTTTSHSLGEGTEVGELVFVPAGPDAAEDEGVLMGFVHDGVTGGDRLELLDAASMDSIAQVHLPTRVPHGFHGNWLPA